ncbi:hypothetical protein [Desertivirga xinjiangensis]|uniref:hypothetical protein n=1 Tax=Desertivirga xinjiangensis TaxID=539206 RepID=UPI002108B7F9|nr:hypothetical protein [Pedobacter xinjiangensis]
MAKKDLNKQYERKHLKAIAQYQQRVRKAYLDAIDKVFESAGSLKFKEGKPFKLSDYPQLNNRVQKALLKFNQEVEVTLINGSKEQWELSDQKNDDIINQHLNNRQVNRKVRADLFQRNDKALEQFVNQKTKGLGLSDRVWKYTNQFRAEIEQNLYAGIKDGRSSAAMARDQKQYLQQPDKLFRRVRDAKGNLKLSKAAKEYKPGRGIYRSSFKNAMRLTRDVTNDAYRTADNVRWANTKFILGFEVKLSNNHPRRDICDDLKGKYPKTFVWRKWHIQCLCYSVPILPDMEEYDKYEDALLAGKGDDFKFTGQVDAVPKAFSDYVNRNKDSLNRLSTPPSWVKDNFEKGDINNGLKVKSIVAAQPTADAIPFRPANIDTYKKELGINVKDDIFQLLNRETPLTNKGGRGAYFNPYDNYVNIPFDARRRESKWYAEAVVYHEYGHAADWQHLIKEMPQVKGVMDKYRKIYSENGNALYKNLHTKLETHGYSSYANNDFDKMNQVTSAADTLMSLNKNYGTGHGYKVKLPNGRVVDYFDVPGHQEAEFIAHMFENKFSGNPWFKELMPDLYDDMIKLADDIIAKVTPK